MLSNIVCNTTVQNTYTAFLYLFFSNTMSLRLQFASSFACN